MRKKIKNQNQENSFKARVLKVVAKIPKGKTLSYKEVAMKAENPKAFRVVGNIMKNNADKNIPCHRVILGNGKIGKYNGLLGKDKQQIILQEKKHENNLTAKR